MTSSSISQELDKSLYPGKIKNLTASEDLQLKTQTLELRRHQESHTSWACEEINDHKPRNNEHPSAPMEPFQSHMMCLKTQLHSSARRTSCLVLCCVETFVGSYLLLSSFHQGSHTYRHPPCVLAARRWRGGGQQHNAVINRYRDTQKPGKEKIFLGAIPPEEEKFCLKYATEEGYTIERSINKYKKGMRISQCISVRRVEHQSQA